MRAVGDVLCCETRRTNGRCGHFQCPYSDETTHGQKCVNIILYGGGIDSVDTAVCDLGEDCLKKCLFSWTASKKNTVNRKRFFVGRMRSF